VHLGAVERVPVSGRLVAQLGVERELRDSVDDDVLDVTLAQRAAPRLWDALDGPRELDRRSAPR
jgi:hypothetical protein